MLTYGLILASSIAYILSYQWAHWISALIQVIRAVQNAPKGRYPDAGSSICAGLSEWCTDANSVPVDSAR